MAKCFSIIVYTLSVILLLLLAISVADLCEKVRIDRLRMENRLRILEDELETLKEEL